MNSWMLIRCPNRGAESGHRIRWGPRNLTAVVVNGMVMALLILLGPLPPWPLMRLQRRCLSCGRLFVAGEADPPDYDHCADCGYDLTGSISGRCPECGWRLPLRYRAWLRRKRRATGSSEKPG